MNLYVEKMAKAKEPWRIRSSDFSKPGWHTRPTIGYELLFEFLRLSPIYELARLESTGTLSEEQKQALTADFGEVRRTYELLGDVQKTLFRTWWLRRGLKAFGNPHSEPKVHGIRVMHALENVTTEDLRDDLDNFLTETRPSEGLNASFLVALPLGLRKADLLKQLDRLLNQREAESKVHQQMPPLALVGQRLRAKVLFSGLRLLWFRAAKPRWEYWPGLPQLPA